MGTEGESDAFGGVKRRVKLAQHWSGTGGIAFISMAKGRLTSMDSCPK